ncbi:MAG: Endonuclease III [Candidatus Argoarchaeum ethanivorans]|uniref:Endonuclease III n=1 Tax=Candidatus Argoarchaeum ethanivorans TaxID=2608793 RepID=A0A811TK00_9EURY|nr:MAG: Endonuclease III [Candidatus Argoarchaeum ethanivorans]CAD6495176.1 MAG: Endonuclease III [Candidatus Argoarchaeum ethanivorans]
MEVKQEQIVEILIERGKELIEQPYTKIEFTGNTDADDLLNDIENFPHAFVLACIMDRQMKAEKAWLIPYEISKEIGGFEFSNLLKLNLDYLKETFRSKSLHRFNDTMAENFYFGIQKIHKNYNNDASDIWKDRPRSATVVRRFLEFKGVGVKIATMAANILAREFKIPISDYICIDISPDTHVKRVFKRLGFISKNATNDELIYCARELNPEYPGIFDLSCWEIGRNRCKPRKPQCENCYLNEYCPKKV